MTGNQDRPAAALAWQDTLFDDLKPEVDFAVGHLKSNRPEGGDLLKLQRFARTIEIIARSGERLVTLQVPKAVKAPRTASPKSEENMTDDDADDSPETLDRLRADLERRLHRVRTLLDTKGLVVEPGCWPVARTGADRIRSS